MRLMISTCLAASLCLASAPAGLAATPSNAAAFDLFESGLWLAKNDKKAQGNGKKTKGDKKAAKANKKEKTPPGLMRKASKEKQPSDRGRATFSEADREAALKRLAGNSAPEGRNLAALAGAGALTLLGAEVVVAERDVEDLIAYRNCPPGLAKKNPPCVPPGLAKKGVTFEEWRTYDQARLDDLWLQRRTELLRRDEIGRDENLLLGSDQIARLFGLDRAPTGKKYALIDGMPVLLDEEDYRSLLLINELAEVSGIPADLSIAPTAALTQDELVRLYRLPPLRDGQNYALLNGQIIRLTDSEYETLQLIRIARAVL